MNPTLLNLAIVDDNGETREIMKERLLEIFSGMTVSASVQMFPSASSYLSSLKDHCFHLTFLDIEMPEMDGIELARKLAKEGIHTQIIYVSNREDRVFDSLETNPFGFVRKSHFTQDIEKAIGHYIDCLKKENVSFFLLQNGKEQMSVRFEDIVYLETVKRKLYFHIHQVEKPFPTSLTLQSVEEEFLDKGFLCSYKGILVNYRFIKVIKNDAVVLQDGTTLPLSRRNTNEVKARYMTLMQDKWACIY